MVSQNSSKIDNYELDLKDRKLLFALDFHSRDSLSTLAKKVGLSKQGVDYKINNLLNLGIIKQFYPVINMPKLGYMYSRISLIMKNTNREKYNEILNYLTNHKRVFWIMTLYGDYDLFFISWSKNITEFKQFKDEIEDKYGDYIEIRHEALATDVIHLQNRYFLGQYATEEIHIKDTEERIKIDEMDKKILRVVCSDARASLVNIAKLIGTTPKVVAYRLKRMQDIGFIEGYRPVINHVALGYIYYKLLLNLNSTRKKDKDTITAYLKSNPATTYIVEGIGLKADIDVEVMVASEQELAKLIFDLRFKFPGLIRDYKTSIYLDTLKIEYFPF